MHKLDVGFSNTDLTSKVLNVNEWSDAVNAMDFLFQPIVNIQTGDCIGYEALLREYEKADFHSIEMVFNSAYTQSVLTDASIKLMDKTVGKYADSGCAGYAKLFVNLDTRILPDIRRFMTGVDAILKWHDIPSSSVVLEMSEKYEIQYGAMTAAAFLEIRNNGIKIALDSYGTRFSGPQLLFNAEPHYIKIDRFFINAIHTDIKKKVFISSLVNTAHMLGNYVIAMGVETMEEFYLCKELGCDMVQGNIVQSPAGIKQGMKRKYICIEEMNRRDKRAYGNAKQLILSLMEHINPVRVFSWDPTTADTNTMLAMFRESPEISFIPVVNEEDEPVGGIQEQKIKGYAYSTYGKALLQNKGRCIAEFISACPTADINASVEQILELFSMNGQAEGVIFTSGGKYAGFLSAKALLRMLHENNIARTRDQNPITKLSGNSIINPYFTEKLLEAKVKAEDASVPVTSAAPSGISPIIGVNSGT